MKNNPESPGKGTEDKHRQDNNSKPVFKHFLFPNLMAEQRKIAYVIRPTDKRPYRWCDEKGVGKFKRKCISIYDIAEGRKLDHSDMGKLLDNLASGSERELLKFSIDNVFFQNGSDLDIQFINRYVEKIGIQIKPLFRKDMPKRGKYLNFINKQFNCLGPWMVENWLKEMEILGISEFPEWLERIMGNTMESSNDDVRWIPILERLTDSKKTLIELLEVDE